MGAPYPERPRFLLCPRCGEMLDRAFEGVASCLRCEGVWIAPATLDATFGAPNWPAGQALWWRNALECPDCAFDGKATVMTARKSGDMIVDQCPEHGLWLDRGELGRLMAVGGGELEALRARLAAIAPDLEQLVARREKWRADVEIRRKAALDYQRAIEEEEQRRAAAAEAERARLDADARVRTRAGTAPTQLLSTMRRPGSRTEAPPTAPHEGSLRAAKRRQTLRPEREPVEVTSEAAAQAAKRRQELGAERAQASADVSVLQGRLAALQDHLRRLEVELNQAQQHASGIRGELDAARAKLRALDEQLEAVS